MATLPWPDAAAKAEITCNAAAAHHVAHLGYGHIRPHYPVCASAQLLCDQACQCCTEWCYGHLICAQACTCHQGTALWHCSCVRVSLDAKHHSRVGDPLGNNCPHLKKLECLRVFVWCVCREIKQCEHSSMGEHSLFISL